ncbi:hypothetical protein JMJ35_004863 [Cladonia borealis]|uniref:GPI anchored serine-threonine rich protein n=1 Tax=Cladonia borealis TaxID=184061 RepID=A0AA39UAX4_9LECA|nr:hypothetical protein JMJ35_004863 [Cladonia borealis]
MHALLFLVAVPLALAHSSLSPRRAPLLPRQAFKPGHTYTDNCDTPCGHDCLDIPAGDTCCAEGYGCPGGNFCLTQGYCCPNGEDPSTCAASFTITLPVGFKASNTIPISTSSASASATVVPTTTAPKITSSASPPPTSKGPTFTGQPKNVTSAAPPATGTGSAPGGVVTFTGGADVLRVGGGIGAIAGGIVGFMLL